MYVCVCHGVTEDDVRRHAADGVCTAKELRVACGMRPGCGQCVQRICALLDEAGTCVLLGDAGVSGAVAA
jgi:bacterioferritin-associated ferredoxin